MAKKKAGDDRKGVEVVAAEIAATETAEDNAELAEALPVGPPDETRKLAEGFAATLVSMMGGGLVLGASRLRDGLALVDKEPADLELSETETKALRSTLADALATLPPSWLMGDMPWVALAVVVIPLAWTRIGILVAVRRASLANREDGAGDAGRDARVGKVDVGAGAGSADDAGAPGAGVGPVE